MSSDSQSNWLNGKGLTDIHLQYVIRLHWKILYRPDLNGGSEIPLIHQDPPLTALDPLLGALNPPLSTFPSLSPALILFRAKLWIDDPVQSRTVNR